jgi:hypothetical protein
LHTNFRIEKMGCRYFKWWVLLFVLLNVLQVHAQPPQRINYQAVARNSDSGAELSNQAIDVVFKILDGSAAGAIVYQEILSTETNQFGLFNVQIGAGTPTIGTLASVDWGSAAKWLAVEIDLGSGLEEVSVSQLISVPYALHAATATSVDNVDDADADPTNELIDTMLLENNLLSIYEGSFPDGHLSTVDLTALVNDADADPTNELLEPGSLQLLDTLLVFVEGGITHQVNLAGLANFGPWQEGPGTVFNTEAYIGVGTNAPEHKLHVINNSTSAIDSVAILADNSNASATINYGLHATAQGATENRAVYGSAPGNSSNNWAGYFDEGNVHVANKLAVGESAPNSTLHTNGSVAGSVRFEQASAMPILLGDDDYMIIVNVTLMPATVVLPPAASCEGRIYYIKRFKTVSNTNTLQISPTGADLIDGTNFSIPLNQLTGLETRMLVSAGANGWFVMSQ